MHGCDRVRAWCSSTTRSCRPAARRSSRRDAEGNSYQQRTLDDGSVHEVLKNFPTRDEAIARLGPRARDAEWIAHEHYWVLSYRLVLMQTNLAPEFKGTREGEAAEAILRKCVHCGFCTATCPTYQLLGDELDGPRGRIYLMKQVLEGAPVTRSTQLHLDRCLTCRNCESTCPSGVQYGHLVDIGRKIVEERVERPKGEKALRWLLKEGLTSPLFGPAMKLGQAVRPLLPASLKNKVPAKGGARAHQWPTREHPRKVLMLLGCVQPAMMPNINSATARVLDAAGIQTLVADEAGCCGALRTHLNDIDGGLRRHAPQHRRLVAAGRGPDLGGQGRGHRHERLGLRRRRQGLRPRAGPRCRLRRARARASAR